MKSYKGILFDFNGTLFFDSYVHINIFQEYFAEQGKEVPTAEYIVKNIFGKSNAQIYADNFAKDENDTAWEQFAEEKEGRYRQFCLDHPEMMRYTEGACEMLDFLKEKGIPYALATGSGMDNVSFYIEHMGLGRWFDESNMVYADGTYPGKPAPDIYVLAAKKLGLDASDCVVCEDGTSGIISALAAGSAVTCVYEGSLPCPLTNGLHAELVYHDFKSWKEILNHFGILR